MTLAVYPGSFDPVTNGHMDVIKRAVCIFDQIVVAVGVNAQKSAWLPAEERVGLLETTLRSEGLEQRVRVVSFSGLLASTAADLGAIAIIKGVRTLADLDSESTQALVNRELSGIETLLLPASALHSRISSSLVRELLVAGAPVSGYVPAAVLARLEEMIPGNGAATALNRDTHK